MTCLKYPNGISCNSVFRVTPRWLCGNLEKLRFIVMPSFCLCPLLESTPGSPQDCLCSGKVRGFLWKYEKLSSEMKSLSTDLWQQSLKINKSDLRKKVSTTSKNLLDHRSPGEYCKCWPIPGKPNRCGQYSGRCTLPMVLLCWLTLERWWLQVLIAGKCMRE